MLHNDLLKKHNVPKSLETMHLHVYTQWLVPKHAKLCVIHLDHPKFMIFEQVIVQCDVIRRIIYVISNKSQYLKNEARYRNANVNANHKHLTSSLKLEGFFWIEFSAA